MGRWTDSYQSWGSTVAAHHRVVRPASLDQALQDIAETGGLPVLAFGCGRSYGDVPLNPDGVLVDCRSLDRFIAFDRTSGLLECEAGLTLSEILAVICRPDQEGGAWLLPVTPGTRFVTVGGAIANDVHGKNHHGFGTFGRHVLSIDLLRADGQRLTCSRSENQELFSATIGGLGLTGLILSARLQLRRVPGLELEVEDIRFSSLDAFFDLAAESDTVWEYTAAWIDCLGRGRTFGRGIYSRARHVAGKRRGPPARSPRISVPLRPPYSLVAPATVRAFNALYARRLGFKTHQKKLSGYSPVLYPLDSIGDWNRLYGSRGFFQFQSVVPMAQAQEATREMLSRIAASGQGSMLSVLKLFGELSSPGLLSFPMPGVTLALDLPNRGAETRVLAEDLEKIVMSANGRFYPAKDSFMSASAFRKGYPGISQFCDHIDSRFSSAFAKRVGLASTSYSLTSPTKIVA